MLILIILSILIINVNSDVIFAKTENYNPSQFCGNGTFQNHTQFTYRIQEPSICSGSVYLLNYVQSASDHFARRMVIRETFGSLKYLDNVAMKLFFVVGLPQNTKTQELINKESDNFRDLVQANFVDTYYNLTLKHIVALHWIRNFCPQAQYITKSDDDTFVNVVLLQTYLKEYFIPQQSFILGEVFTNETPIRAPGYKWTVDNETYSGDKYPPFMKGFGYVMSQAAIEPLLVCSYYHKFFFIDDIFITGIVAKSAGITLRRIDTIYSYSNLKNETIPMTIMNSIFVVGNNVLYPERWKETWRKILMIIS